MMIYVENLVNRSKSDLVSRESARARLITHFSSFLGNLKISNPHKTANMHFSQKLKKLLSDNVFIMIYVENFVNQSKSD